MKGLAKALAGGMGGKKGKGSKQTSNPAASTGKGKRRK